MGAIRGPLGCFEYPGVVYQTLRSVIFWSASSRVHIVPNTTRWMSRSLLVRCTAPAKRRRRLRIVVPTLSHCAFLEPWCMTCGGRCAVGAESQSINDPHLVFMRRLRCAVRSSAKCSRPRSQVTHPYRRVSITFHMNGASSISYGSRLKRS